MTTSSFQRYANLLTNIRNWPAYFTRKSASTFKPAHFVTRGGVQFDVPTHELYLVFKEIFMSDFYSVKEWIGNLPPEPLVVDIGGNAGYFAMMLLSRRPDTRMVAYEPVPQNFQLYQKNLDLNPAVGHRVKAYPFAVTGKPIPSVTLYKESNSENSVTASVYTDFEASNEKAITVEAISLQEILTRNGIEKVDLLKLDCEGSEYPIVYESPEWIWPKISSIFLEVHNLDKGERNLDAMNKFLHAHGYRTTQKLAENGCYAVYATRQ